MSLNGIFLIVVINFNIKGMIGETPSKRSINTTISLSNNLRGVSSSIVASDLERLVLEKQFNE